MAPKYEQKAKRRIKQGIPRFAGMLDQALQRGINEADTTVIVNDVLRDLLGYRKVFEITKEYEVRGHRADFAIMIDNKPRLFIEVKAAGAKLRERDIFQVLSYSRQFALEWAVLTNGAIWQCYHIAPSQPQVELFFSVSLLGDREAIEQVVGRLYLLSREALWRNVIKDEWERSQALGGPRVASVLLSEPVLLSIRRELRKATGRRLELELIREAVARGVVRADVYEEMQEKFPAPRRRRVTRKAGQKLPPECFAYVPDLAKRSTWKLSYRKKDGSVDPPRLAGAVAALSPGAHRGRAVKIPPECMAEVKANLRKAYRDLGKAEHEMPPGILNAGTDALEHSG